jgi:uncharacterized membrane protein YhaH (DUF805 family)
MAQETRLNRRWKRTVWHLLAVDVVAIGILISLAVKRLRDDAGPSYLALFAILLALIAASVAFYWIARSIRDNIGRRYGED